MIKLKRAYEAPTKSDGSRILVERLWPRGLTKEKAQIGLWLKEIGPSTELRKWYSHDVAKWPEFRRRYEKELAKNGALVEQLALAAQKNVTFIYAAHDEEHNSAVVLKEFIERSKD